ncbi:efflux RND transporter periplasmic adaptor subunit [Aquabacterium sp. A7-Y]|uniref:efflux RND transporter periplasmic adaptor subunit n=1 Tax=Aquabacterium sp. A7-Y TaxID=1349605 RepID=UPI00223E55B4|nr:efflux RND transporter periplasmic adaptor subunit [Aquabacterium sp. A7-Y]MCW7538260.1 efflux RND transporter periplasmic adaptor subunit [Aquabacterium sp. A7-Y]
MRVTTRRWLKWLLPTLVVLVLGAAVGRAIKAKQADRAQATQAAGVAAAALELAPTDLVPVQRQELVRRLPISGSLEAVSTAVVKAKVAAEVRELGVREGDKVRAGQLIAQLDTSEYAARLRQAQEQAASARAQLEIAERTLQNNRALVDQGFISKNALDTSVSNAAAARATLLAAQANADLARKALDDTALRAPIPGQVSQRFVQAGERVGVDGRVVEIVDLSRIELKAAVAPEDVAQLQVGSRAQLQVDGLATPVAAEVARINPGTQAGTRAVLVYLSVQPQAGLRHGLFASGQVELGRGPALAVPEGSVRRDQPEPYVLVVQDGKVVHKRVSLGPRGSAGPRGEALVAVASGLSEGDRVLQGSLGLVRDGTPVRVTAMAPAAAASR